MKEESLYERFGRECPHEKLNTSTTPAPAFRGLLVVGLVWAVVMGVAAVARWAMFLID